MIPVLVGVLIGALLPIGLAVLDAFVQRQKRRRWERNYLRRSIPLHSGR